MCVSVTFCHRRIVEWLLTGIYPGHPGLFRIHDMPWGCFVIFEGMQSKEAPLHYVVTDGMFSFVAVSPTTTTTTKGTKTTRLYFA